METIPTLPTLLPRPDYSQTYRKPLEYFVDDSIVIIVGNKQARVTGRAVDLYENCRIFTVLTDKPGTKNQRKVFEERPILDHLWIPNNCNKWNKKICVPDIFAIGKIEWYTRKDGSKDLTLAPVDKKIHLECLFIGIIFIYGLHIMEESKNLTTKGIVTDNYKYWCDQVAWLKLITEKFKETIKEEKIDLEKPLMLKYIDCFLNEITKKTKKARNHVRKITAKKGFQEHKLNYI